jgi:hypothetical protein
MRKSPLKPKAGLNGAPSYIRPLRFGLFLLN